MVHDFLCRSWDSTKLDDVLLNTWQLLIRSANHTCSIFGFFDSIFVSFCSFIIFYTHRRQRVISVFSVTISIIFSIGFSYISALYRYHELIKRLVVHELDVRSKFQGSGDALYMHFVDGDRDALFARMEAHVKDKYEDLFTRLQGFSFFITEEQIKTLPLKFRNGSAERLLEIMCQLRSPVYPIFP